MKTPDETLEAWKRAAANSLVESFNAMFGDRAVAVALTQTSSKDPGVAAIWESIALQISVAQNRRADRS